MTITKNYSKAFNETLKTIAASSFDGTFQPIGDPLENPVRLLKFKNDSDQDVTISYDGVNDHDLILEGDREVEDLTTNRTIDEGLARKEGTQIYAKASSGTGNFYVTAIYAGKV